MTADPSVPIVSLTKNRNLRLEALQGLKTRNEEKGNLLVFLTNLPPSNTELQSLRLSTTSTTSQPKKVKLSSDHPSSQNSSSNSDIPLASVEGRDSHSPPLDLPRFSTSANPEAAVPAIPSHLQSSASFGASDYISSVASSPSAAYANLSLEGERVAEQTSPEIRRTSLAPNEADTRGHSPVRSFSHRAIMGGAADLPQRSSSPLKRRASDLEAEATSSQKDDVDMIMVPPTPPEAADEPIRPISQSVDMTETASKTEVATLPADTPALSKTAETDIPSIDEQITTVTTLCQAAAEKQLEDGDVTYLVSKRWLGRVICRGSEALKSSKEKPQGEIGPIDNSDIIEQIITDCEGHEFAQLKKTATSGADFEFFPKDAWNLVVDWYGLMKGSVGILRVAHNTNPDKLSDKPNIVYELHPPVFTVHRVFGENNPISISQKLKATNPPAPIFVFSRSTTYITFLKKLKAHAEVDPTKKVRIWRVPRLLPAAEPTRSVAGTTTPPSSRPGSPANDGFIGPVRPREVQDSWTHLLLDVAEFTQLERGTGRELIEYKDVSTNANYNGHLDLHTLGLGDDQTIVIDELVTGDSYVSNYVSNGKKTTPTALARTSGGRQSTSQPNSGRNSPAPSGPMTRGRAQKNNGRTKGISGFSNLGNTCYMNSALQCVRSVEELTKYFLTGAARKEVNYDNPLGHRGDIALTYGKLLEEIYGDNPATSVTPRHFKQIVSKVAPTFSGYGQQDSQEFIGFLLDGIQEDLSRVMKKPYIEKPDSTDEMVNNPEAIKEMAAKVWDITKKRDDSVIADLFTGMYKSTLVCPVCDKVSITFDPFNQLTLQLPVENFWSHEIVFLPLNDKPVQMTVDIDKHATMKVLKDFVSKRVGVPVSRLFAAEQFKNKFYKIYDDSATASEVVSGSDHCWVYELEAEPTNWPARKKAKKAKAKKTLGYESSEDDDIPSWDSPLAERMVVPVFHRFQPPEPTNRYTKAKRWEVGAAPHFIVLSPDEARSEEMIKRKVLEKIATFSTFPEFLEDDDANASVADSIDPDIVLTTGSDADSAGGSKVVANSIDGEDELVDVTMKDSNGVRDVTEKSQVSSNNSETSVIAKFNRTRPKFMTPGSLLNPGLQNMFEVGYVSSPKELIVTGWQTVDDDKEYPSIASRNPHLDQTLDDIDEPLDGYAVTNGRSASESSEEDAYPPAGLPSTTRMVEESSSEEDAPLGPRKALPVRLALQNSTRPGTFKKRRAGIKTYSKKGNRLPRKVQHTLPVDQDAPDEGPLVRLGEGLVIDWSPEAWDALFGARSFDDRMRGTMTFSETNIEHLDDPELKARQLARQKRRKHGITLDDCLDEFGKEEILSEMDTWYCPRCKKHQRASKKFELWKTPDILIMHLKRFSSSGHRRDKLDISVDFPLSGLDLSPRVAETEDGKLEIYDLFAVDDHWGGLGGGHYTAFAKNFVNNKWYNYNDSSASEVRDLNDIVTASAYLLFYRRRSDVPLGGPRFKQILDEYDNPREVTETDTESGEDQSLAGNSSLRGSSSALTGAGAVLRPNHGSDGEGMMTINPSALETLPSYEAYQQGDDAIPLLVDDDTVMKDGLHQSIENENEDEGIDMDYQDFPSSNKAGIIGSWNFNNLSSLGQNARGQMVSGTGSNIDDAASDLVNHNSSASEGSMKGRLEDFENAVAEDDDGPYVDQSPVPDLDEDSPGFASAIALQQDMIENMHGPPIYGQAFEVRAEEVEEVEEPATEIHISEDDELKMD